MKLSYLEIFLIAASFLLILFLIGQSLYWRYKKRTFTRERFAFFGVSSMITVLTIVLPIVVGSNNTWLVLLNYLLKEVGKPEIRLVEPGISDRILAILCLVLFIYFILRIFNNWNGEKSQRQHEMEKNREISSILKDLKAYLKGDEKINKYAPEKKEDNDFIVFENKYDKQPWHRQVGELLNLYSKKIRIDPEKDWFRKEKILLSKYDEEGQLFVLCSNIEPNEEIILEFLKFVDRYKKGGIAKLIVAIKYTINDDFKQSNLESDYEIEFITEEELIEGLIDFSHYLEYLRASFEEKTIMDGVKQRLIDVYTPPKGYIQKREKSNENTLTDPIKNVEGYIGDWLKENESKKQLAILGEYGQGKSVLSLRIAYLMATGAIETDRIPIIIELRGKYPSHFVNNLAFLSEWAANFDINAKALLKLHYAGKTLLIFEGFDEMKLVGDYEVRLDHFRKIWKFSTPKSKIIITGRPNFFLNNSELSTLLRTSDFFTNLPYCEELYLEKFDLNQIKSALRSFDENIRNDISSILELQNENDSFYDLMKRPSSLFLSSVVWNKRNLSKLKNDLNSAIVIEEFLKDSYSRQAEKGLKTPLSVYERAYFMQGLAIGMVIKNGYTNQISQNELRGLIIKLLENFPEELTKRRIAPNSYTKPLQNRFIEEYNEESILVDIRSCGVLVRDLGTFDSFKFSHKSFLELLVSKHFVSAVIEFDDKDDVENIIKNAINLSLKTKAQEIPKSLDSIKFIFEIGIKRIQFPGNLSKKQQLRFLFTKFYPKKFLNASIFLFLIKVSSFKFYRIDSIRVILIFSVFILILFLTWVLYFLLRFSSVWSFNIYTRVFVLVSIILSFIFFYSSPLYKRYSLQIKKTAALISLDLREVRNFLFSSSELTIYLEALKFQDDKNNIVLWYMISKGLGLENELKKYFPKRLLAELKFREALFKKDKDFLEKFISLMEEDPLFNFVDYVLNQQNHQPRPTDDQTITLDDKK